MPLCTVLLKKLTSKHSTNNTPDRSLVHPVGETLMQEMQTNKSIIAHLNKVQDEGSLGNRVPLKEQETEVLKVLTGDNSRTSLSDATQMHANTSWGRGEASEGTQETVTSSFYSIIDRLVEISRNDSVVTQNPLLFNGSNLNETVWPRTNSTNAGEWLIGRDKNESVFVHEFQLIKAVVLIIVLSFLMVSTCKLVLQSSAQHSQTKDEAA